MENYRFVKYMQIALFLILHIFTINSVFAQANDSLTIVVDTEALTANG